MTIKALFPSSEPALELDFANTKALDPRVSFTRASTGTYVGADGLIKNAARGAARFDHTGTGESLGLLVEEARTNSYPRSTSPSGADVTRTGFTLNSTVSPDGASNGILFVPTSTNDHSWSPYYTGLPANTNYTLSVFVKAKELSRIGLGIISNTAMVFNSATGQIISGSGTVQLFPNGWYRCSVTIATNASGEWDTRLYLLDNSGNFSYTANGTDGIYLWGFQFEQSSLPSSYIPTSGATATRAADVATVSNTNSSIFPTSSFTTINSPFGTAGGGSTVKLVGPTIKRTAIYNGDLPQAQINALTGTDQWWRWRVTGPTFALPNFTTNGNITVDWGDGVVETLTTGVHTFLDSNVYHTIGFRLNSGTFFKPSAGNNTYTSRIIALGPTPSNMKVDGSQGFRYAGALRSIDGYIAFLPGTNLANAWQSCSSLAQFPAASTTGVGGNLDQTWNSCSSMTSFPLIDTSSVIGMTGTWNSCAGLTSFPLINTSSVTYFNGGTWQGCSSLTSFPLINTGSVTVMDYAWQGCSNLTSFPLINTANVSNFNATWNSCSSLTFFPLINTAAGTNFNQTWRFCSSLTSFPLINTAAGTNFGVAWQGCQNLTSFPLIDTASGTEFGLAWKQCYGLTSFPLINTSSGTNFYETWQFCTGLTAFPALSFASATSLNSAWTNCYSLSSFPANMFNTTGNLVSNAFENSFSGCALTATSIENILTSLVTNGRSNITLWINGGTNAGASTWTANAIAAYNTLISRGWTILRNA
jgi:hypothetical protein